MRENAVTPDGAVTPEGVTLPEGAAAPERVGTPNDPVTPGSSGAAGGARGHAAPAVPGGAAVPGDDVFAWSRELVTPALRAALEGMPSPEREAVAFHRGWSATGQPAVREYDRVGGPTGAGGGPGSTVASAGTSTSGTGTRAGGHGGTGGGKALRPALTFLSAMAVGAAPGAVVPGAVAVEMVHDFSLVHDDVIDADPLRRHRPAVWKKFGTPAAVLVGDALLARAVALLAAEGGPAGERAVREMAGALEQLLAGQSQDVAFERRRRVTVEQYLEMARGKTGALIGCACALGGVLAGVPEWRVSGLRDFGRHLGVAFQCADDVLGIWGRTERSGKPVGADVTARKKSLPVVAALAHDSAVGRELGALYEQPEPFTAEDVDRATRLIEQAGGKAAAEAEAEAQVDRALCALARAKPAPRADRRLRDLAGALIRRDR
ncbi:polyprenyl synthetase family protein [Streptomyces tubbatahanensis]|uniref:Polyprenyl synthetase family protein n=1 Tax=Streptomyces tubbatahanensis TaxID=2923272 RepID=A0ABY3Y101_9ACTN|nr:polyprenyl synthetase family protein [Streptomyces tubbatahanensis]UNT00274.1 polyprenyl synthetase family protein [Streptomyces tubbatahanensis]